MNIDKLPKYTCCVEQDMQKNRDTYEERIEAMQHIARHLRQLLVIEDLEDLETLECPICSSYGYLHYYNECDCETCRKRDMFFPAGVICHLDVKNKWAVCTYCSIAWEIQGETNE